MLHRMQGWSVNIVVEIKWLLVDLVWKDVSYEADRRRDLHLEITLGIEEVPLWLTYINL